MFIQGSKKNETDEEGRNYKKIGIKQSNRFNPQGHDVSSPCTLYFNVLYSVHCEAKDQGRPTSNTRPSIVNGFKS